MKCRNNVFKFNENKIYGKILIDMPYKFQTYGYVEKSLKIERKKQRKYCGRNGHKRHL